MPDQQRAPHADAKGRKATSTSPYAGHAAETHTNGSKESEQHMSNGNQRRNKTFHPAHEPLQHSHDLHLHASHTTGPLSFLNPTRAHFRPTSTTDGAALPASEAQDVTYEWTSRNNRKGRHALAVNSEALDGADKHDLPPSTSSPKSIARGLWRMLTVYPVWDVSYDVATIFTLGSAVWLINAFFVFLPLIRPDTEFTNEELYGGGITAFIGVCLFEVGSVLLVAEAVNENRTGCFGWALRRALSRDSETGAEKLQYRPEKEQCSHHHPNTKNLVGKGKDSQSQTEDMGAAASSSSDDQEKQTHKKQKKSWVWFPSKKDLRDHYVHELGFLASVIQLIAASIFWVAGLVALPGIYDSLNTTTAAIFYWTPQVVGGLGFIASGALFMVETQSHWWKPAPGTLGWWVGAFNTIGGVGFTLCPAFGYDTRSWAQYQASCSTFWGSWAFLIGSAIQWYESLEKWPVARKNGKRSGQGRKA